MYNGAKRISKDFLYNIIASLIFTGVMQVIVYPTLAGRFGSEEYGLILTIMGIVNAVVIALGNSLNNVRLIQNSVYEQEKAEGDFNILLLLSAFSATIIILFLGAYIYKLNYIITSILAVYAGISVIRTYCSVEFRLILDFKKILLGNIFGAVGYIVGTLILSTFQIWVLPFILSEIFYCIYILVATKIYREKYKITCMFKRTVGKYAILIITSFSGTLLTYLDRLIIYPLLGGEAVSIYTVASFFGKTLGIVTIPIAGVMLGYFAQSGFRITNKRFWQINCVTLLGGGCFMGMSIIFAPFFTSILYPSVFESAKKYIFIANLAATLGVVCNLTQSSVLKFAPTWLQLVKEAVYGIVYIGVGALLLDKYGLIGFCIAAIMANVMKLFTLYVIGGISIKGNKA